MFSWMISPMVDTRKTDSKHHALTVNIPEGAEPRQAVTEWGAERGATLFNFTPARNGMVVASITVPHGTEFASLGLLVQGLWTSISPRS